MSPFELASDGMGTVRMAGSDCCGTWTFLK